MSVTPISIYQRGTKRKYESPAVTKRNTKVRSSAKKYPAKKSATSYKKTQPRNKKPLGPPVPKAVRDYNAIIDRPFGQNTYPACLPDSFAGQSIPLLLKLVFNLQTDANGAAAVQVFPLPHTFQRAGTVTFDVASFADGVAHNQWASYTTSIQRFRPICLATKCQYIGEAQTRSGVMSSTISPDTPTAKIADWASENSHSSITTPIGNNSVVSTSRLFDHPTFHDTSTGTEPVLAQMGQISLGFSGLPASKTCIRVETRLFLECIPKLESALGANARASPTASAFNIHTQPSNHHLSDVMSLS